VLAASILAATAMLSGCGGDNSDDSGLGASDSPVVTDDDGDPMLACPGSDSTFSTADAGSADCADPSPALKEGNSWVTIVGTPAGVTADETSFEISVAERDCTGATNPTLHSPLVIKTDDSVTLYMTMDTPAASSAPETPAPAAGDTRYCVGNPVVYGTVDLGEALGKRAVFDGSTWPPTKIDDAPVG
jgi:hypothetical protein